MSDYPHSSTGARPPPPEARASPDELVAEVRAAAENAVVRALLDAIDGGLLVLNAHRQIVAANLRGLTRAGSPEARAEQDVLGLRTGEALGCRFAVERPGGCGAAEACRTCGAVKTILGSQWAQASVDGECLLTTPSGARELGLRASPLEVEGRSFTVVALRDLGDEKRRSVLEEVFLHDLANLIAPLSSTAQLMSRVPVDRLRSTGEKMAALVRRLESEVHAQRALLEAERGSLALAPSRVRPGEVLRELKATFEAHPLARGRAVEVLERGPEPLAVETDRTLLLRILTNMAANALEATPEGGAVRAWGSAPGRASRWACGFHVHNHAPIPSAVAARIFQRSFSTKARKGRGIGTYSMKLLGERYLGGEVSFTSREGAGTTFSLWLPERAPGLREVLD